MQLIQPTTFAIAEPVDLVEQNTDATFVTGFHHLDNAPLAQQGENRLAEERAGPRVAGIELHRFQTSCIEYTVGKGRFSYTGLAQEENGGLLSSLQPVMESALNGWMETYCWGFHYVDPGGLSLQIAWRPHFKLRGVGEDRCLYRQSHSKHPPM